MTLAGPMYRAAIWELTSAEAPMDTERLRTALQDQLSHLKTLQMRAQEAEDGIAVAIADEAIERVRAALQGKA